MPSFDPFIGDPKVGEPNPELDRFRGPQKLFIIFIAAGLLALIGLLAYLPSIAAT